MLTNGALAANVFWVVGTEATLGAQSAFSGSVYAGASITAGTGATVVGRLLASVGTVSLAGVTITDASFPGCAGLLGARAPSPLP